VPEFRSIENFESVAVRHATTSKDLVFDLLSNLAIDLHLPMAAVRKAALGRDVKPEK
jgi:hypothetical protein